MTHQAHSQTGPFTEQELTLIQVANETSSLLGHHHHHHHHNHIQYQAPTQLNTNLGLFALKKLQAMDPRFLRVQQARVLEPVTPGTLSFIVDNTFKIGTGVYAAYIWRSLGWKGFASKAIIPLGALMATHRITLYGLNYIREGVFSIQRKNLVDKYTEQFGEKFLLNALDPNFRL